MDVLEAIQVRRSIRLYTGDPIPRVHLEIIVDAGRLAPSGNNQQPWDFIVVTDRATIQRLKIVAEWIDKAGAVIGLVMDPSSRWWIEDGAAAVENMLLASTALGYGACWLEGYTLQREDQLKKLLDVPADRRLLTLIAIGIPAEAPVPWKKSLAQVIHWEKY
jgi:nitroreductase